ncbi:MAG: hypothetical protein ACRDHY_08345 [Anaerolineales bacterium]
MRQRAGLLLLAVLAIPLGSWLEAGDLDCADCGGACAAACGPCSCCPVQAAADVPPVVGPSAVIAPAFSCIDPAPPSALPLGVFHVPKSA